MSHLYYDLLKITIYCLVLFFTDEICGKMYS